MKLSVMRDGAMSNEPELSGRKSIDWTIRGGFMEVRLDR